MILLVIISILVATNSARYDENMDNERDFHHTGECNSRTVHQMKLDRATYNFTACFDSSKGSLCLTKVPLVDSCQYVAGQCYTYHWISNYIAWNATVCQNPFSLGYCFWQSSIRICTENQLAACTCTSTILSPPPPSTEPTQESPTTEATTETPQPSTEPPEGPTPPNNESCIYTTYCLDLGGGNKYTITVCLDESEDLFCLTEPPLQKCLLIGQCYQYRWWTYSIDWNIVVCKSFNEDIPDWCFLKTNLPICPEVKTQSECTCITDYLGREVCTPENCEHH